LGAVRAEAVRVVHTQAAAEAGGGAMSEAVAKTRVRGEAKAKAEAAEAPPGWAPVVTVFVCPAAKRSLTNGAFHAPI
jgi:hypothetical protein